MLSLEELGKFLAHNEDVAFWNRSQPPMPRARLYHKPKQKLAAQAVIWGMGSDEVKELMAVQGYSMVLAPLDANTSNGPSEVDGIATIDDEAFLTKVANKIRRSSHHRFVIDLAKGNLIRLSKRHFTLMKAVMAAFASRAG